MTQSSALDRLVGEGLFGLFARVVVGIFEGDLLDPLEKFHVAAGGHERDRRGPHARIVVVAQLKQPWPRVDSGQFGKRFDQGLPDVGIGIAGKAGQLDERPNDPASLDFFFRGGG